VIAHYRKLTVGNSQEESHDLFQLLMAGGGLESIGDLVERRRELLSLLTAVGRLHRDQAQRQKVFADSVAKRCEKTSEGNPFGPGERLIEKQKVAIPDNCRIVLRGC
jgi:hypothetical protein